ncbi:MAG: hypothetical protein D8M58_18660 [Calditrichaeota bacterium]|nr:MAG: hypothetical protein DWQ03_21340 [Calditrichota bacterium]MBL1207432.1 hypothetical protein [Calditrichota bacterium]NOG47264.1 hypothetical protein [Calditrichota bacterium]
MKTFKLIITALLVLPIFLSAQETKSKYSIGMKSTIITSKMKLSELDAQFSDLKSNGNKGPHFNTIYLMVEHNSYFRYGLETLIANSDIDGQTTYAIQAAGLVAELYYGETFFVNGGVQIGAAIISAMAKDGKKASDSEVQTGSHFKAGGVLFSPYVNVGYKIGKWSPYLTYKPIYFSGEKDSQADLFDGSFFGAGFSYSL